MPKRKSRTVNNISRDKNNNKQGKFEDHFLNGKLRVRCFYINNEIHGEYKAWNVYGNLYEHSHYTNGKFDGRYKEWFKSGQLEINCYYDLDELVGEFKRWDTSGILIDHLFLKDGKNIIKEITLIVANINNITLEEECIIKLIHGIGVCR